jgi:arsenate reductase
MLAAGLCLSVLLAVFILCIDSFRESKITDPRGGVVFACRNGVSMSVWSALTFDRLAANRGLPFRAAARATTTNYSQVPARMRLALLLDGLFAGRYHPIVLTPDDVVKGTRLILIDVDLPHTVRPQGSVERWTGFPPMREDYWASRAALQLRIEDLVARLAASER